VIYSNVIIFGDSQSDIGNGPESMTYKDPFSDNASSDPPIASNLYVPISNPVNVRKDKILPNLNIQFPPIQSRDKRFKLTLPASLPICADSVCYTKKYRSLNWTEYFVYNGIKKGLIASPADLRPWIIQYSQSSKPVIGQSVNYAFYSALSNRRCHRVNYLTRSCNVSGLSLNMSIYKMQNKYRTNQSKTNNAQNKHLRYSVTIPSVQKQIEMFKNDLRSNKVIVNANTLYIVWTAANDIGEVFKRYEKKEISVNTLENTLQVTIPNLVAGKNTHSVVNELIKLGARHILVLGQYNLGLTPEALEKHHLGFVKRAVVSKVAQLITSYNASLQQLIAKNFNSKFVQYVDLQTPIDNVIFNPDAPFYYQTLGKECDPVVLQEQLKKGGSISCYNDDVSSPVCWGNKAHLSTQLNQMIAAAVLNALHSN